jgi:hypothetical protein
MISSMIVQGLDYALSVAGGNPAPIKMVFNANGVIFFPATEQHRDQKAAGISYEDDYRGNALAAILENDHLAIRFHKDFSAERVVQLIGSLASIAELSFFKQLRVTYQGRDLMR